MTTSQTMVAADNIAGKKIEFTVGLGFTNDELVDSASTALQDLITGLVCFDKISFPLGSLAPVHDTLGSELFWRLVSEGCFVPVWKKTDSVIIFPAAGKFSGGTIAMATPMGPGGDRELSLAEVLQKILYRGVSTEAYYDKKMKELEGCVIYDDKIDESSIPGLVGGVLSHQEVQRAIGMSDCVMPSKIPRILTFPVLRVAHVVEVGIITQTFGMAATNISFGGDVLAGPIFSASASDDWAHLASNYVIAGQFTEKLSINPLLKDGLINGILKFRDTEIGINFRKEVLERLSVKNGSEFISSINAGLKRSLPGGILERARSGMKAYVPDVSNMSSVRTSVMCGDGEYSDLALWRKRSLKELRDFCAREKIGKYDRCPCGSGESLGHCCEGALMR